MIRTRAIVSFAWVVGPPVATACTGLFGSASALALLAGIGLVNMATAVLLLHRRGRCRCRDRDRDRRIHGPSSQLPRPRVLTQLRGWERWGVIVAFVVLQVTNIASVTVATLFVTRELHAPIVWAGIILGTGALFEIPALLLIGRLLALVPARILIIVSCVIGALYYSLAAASLSPWMLVALQPLNAWFFATVAGVGLTVFQETFSSPGLASGLFTNTRRVGAVLSGLLIAALTGFPDTFRAVYAAAAILVALVLIGYLATTVRGRTIEWRLHAR